MGCQLDPQRQTLNQPANVADVGLLGDQIEIGLGLSGPLVKELEGTVRFDCLP